MYQAIAVLDIGKTRSKLSLWSPAGERLRQDDYANLSTARDSVAQLDVEGIWAWTKTALAAASREAEIVAIIPVGHGAAGVLMDGDRVVVAIDYEAEPPVDIAAAYDALRDPFGATLSPRLPGGLNLGAQLYWLERLHPGFWPNRGRLLLWPQFWAWRLSGERASEITSLGCHTDLWRPLERRFSDLALTRGWAERLPSLRPAGEILGSVRPALADELGLPRACAIHVGLHDSNAALHAARGLSALAGGAFAVVSTGTWFVSMAVGGAHPVKFDPAEDMLANVDVAGAPVPTARFMGGREHELWMGDALGAASEPGRLAEAAALGPEWRGTPPSLRATRGALELARKTDRALGLIAADGPVLIEGRFADDPAFGASLARLRPDQPIYRNPIADGVALGALRLARPDMTLPFEPAPVWRPSHDAPGG